MRVPLMAREVGALVDDVSVPLEAKPLESVEDRAGAFVRAAGSVRVFDPEKELAAVVFDVEPVEERRARATDVEVAGGAGGETEAVIQKSLSERRERDSNPRYRFNPV